MQYQQQTKSRVKAAAAIAIAWSLGAALSIGSQQPADASENSAKATAQAPDAHSPNTPVSPSTPVQLDRSGQKRVGKASFYADRYSGKTMADGTPMRLYSNNAASITLPLGTTARVTNLETGRSAVVTIRDRGPYVHGRIVDLSPATARKIGLERKKGIAKVEVAPLTVPMADGTVKVMSNALAMAAN